MTVYLFSQSYEIGQIINDHLISNKYSCFLFPQKEAITTEIKNRKTPPDLLILDYTMYNHDFFNIFKYLNQIKIELPVIFFNDPCITASTRTKHWLSQLKRLTYKEPGKQFTDEKLSEYEKLFSKIEEIVELEELAPYIELMQKTKPLPDYLKKHFLSIEYIKANDSDYIYDFKKKINLSGSLFFLLQILEQNKNIPMTLEEILEYYKKEGKKMTTNSLKVLISKLRKEISNDKDCKFTLSSNKGVYSLSGF